MAQDAVQSSLAPKEDDKPIVDYILSVAASTYMLGDPLWGWIIGPPGSMKTEVLRSFNEHADVVFLSSLTPQSLVSGYERADGTDPSLLPKFNNKLVIVKEFTSILGLPDAHVRQIFGDLRSMYDGFHAKGFGTVGLRAYRSRFSLLAAVTPAIDKYTLIHTDLGERFIALRISRGGTSDWRERGRQAEHVWAASETKDIWRAALKLSLHEALDGFRESGRVLPSFSPQMRTDLIHLADLLSLLRTVSDDPSTPVPAELATRTTQQVKLLAAGRCLMDARDVVSREDLKFVRRVVFDSLPAAISRTVSVLYTKQKALGAGAFIDLKQLAHDVHLPYQWLFYLARQYGFCGLLHRNGQAIRCTDELIDRLDTTRLVLAGPDLHSSGAESSPNNVPRD